MCRGSSLWWWSSRSSYGPRALYIALQMKACDYVMPDFMRIGGVTGWQRSIYDPAEFLVEGMVSIWTQRSSCHRSNPAAPVFAVMRRAIPMASASFSQATPWI
jgi:L-alanine-DL-glutamate epimerase-like enolase superfamily enzyme